MERERILTIPAAVSGFEEFLLLALITLKRVVQVYQNDEVA